MSLPDVVRLEYDEIRSAANLEKHGWRFIEVLETWEASAIRIHTPESGVTAAKPEDVDACAAIARKAFTKSRLHKDPMVSKEDADDFKEQWVRLAFTERAKKIFVARSVQGEIQGFIIIIQKEGIGIVDLLAVHPDHKSEGVGGRLLRHAMMATGLPFRAGTQSDNKEARILYKRNGFEIKRRQRTYHR